MIDMICRAGRQGGGEILILEQPPEPFRGLNEPIARGLDALFND